MTGAPSVPAAVAEQASVAADGVRFTLPTSRASL